MEYSTYLYVAIGGALGSVLRAYISQCYVHAFPWSTLFVNAVGSLMIGVFYSYLSSNEASFSKLNPLVIVGFCGGFTTFSTFSLQTLELLKAGQLKEACTNIVLSFLICLVCVIVGSGVVEIIRK